MGEKVRDDLYLYNSLVMCVSEDCTEVTSLFQNHDVIAAGLSDGVVGSLLHCPRS